MARACDCCQKHLDDVINFSQETIPIAARMGVDTSLLTDILSWATKVRPIVSPAQINTGQYDADLIKESGKASGFRKKVQQMASQNEKDCPTCPQPVRLSQFLKEHQD
ncbi:MAG: hypothetical protein PHI12_06710 [Dehalococcoidales bacterium]|nr:hypothetical protein [Candidatus Omnitrophota bacterium]MDD5510480.1 hypothetical protein [Dehalococcoidales bacterium]